MGKDKYIVTKNEIDDFKGTEKTHFLNQNAKRLNKSLGDLTGLKCIGFHIIEVSPNCESTEFHKHYHEDECVYILEGEAQVKIGETSYKVFAGDFIGYRANGLPHSMVNTGEMVLKCIVVGNRFSFDVGEYPNKNLRILRDKIVGTEVINLGDISRPQIGKK